MTTEYDPMQLRRDVDAALAEADEALSDLAEACRILEERSREAADEASGADDDGLAAEFTEMADAAANAEREAEHIWLPRSIQERSEKKEKAESEDA